MRHADVGVEVGAAARFLLEDTMAGDRTLAPSRARLALAHAAGLRGSSRWLALGLASLFGAALVGSWRADVGTLGESWKTALMQPETLGDALSSWSAVALRSGVALLAASVGLSIVLTVVSGAWGSIDPRARARLGLGRTTGGGLPRAALVLALVFLLGFVSLGVIAGSARAIDATPSSLAMFWRVWTVRLLVWVGAGCVVAGLVDLVVQGRVRWLALHQSVQEARDEARERGSRRA